MIDYHQGDLDDLAREVIATAELLGYNEHSDARTLQEEADNAARWISEHDNQPDPDRCPECDALQLCDCRIYPAAYGRDVYPLR